MITWIIKFITRQAVPLLIGLVSISLFTGGVAYWKHAKASKLETQNEITGLKSTLAENKIAYDLLEDQYTNATVRINELSIISEDRQQRREAWKEEALKWKNLMIRLQNENPTIREWAATIYPAELK